MKSQSRTNHHTFVICAYKESPYLAECIESLMDQSLKSRVIMVTSTPCEYLKGMAERYHIPLYVNPGKPGITEDWNYGLSLVETKLATIAHQDDIYCPDYTETMINNLKYIKKPILLFSDYGELRNGRKVAVNRNLRIKKLMLLPLRPGIARRSRLIRRFILSFGDPICCPSVMYAMRNINLPLFENHYSCSEDWEAWEKLSKESGDFIYIPKILMYHRIHEESTTTKALTEGSRINENYEMYRKFWPAPVAGMLNKWYTRSEESNEL